MASHFTEIIAAYSDDVEQRGKLYLSGYKAAANEAKLEEYSVKLIVSMMQLDVSKFKPALNTKVNGIKVKIFPVEDIESSDISKYFFETTNLIAEAIFAGQNVLIHCENGYSRSPTIAIAFKMRFWYQSFEDTFKEINAIDSHISPNFGFRMQLKEYEKFLKIKEKNEAKKDSADLRRSQTKKYLVVTASKTL